MVTMPEVLVQWEYLISRFHRDTPHLHDISPDPKYADIKPLAYLGEQGWEMIGFGGWAGEYAFAFFKRVVRVEEEPCACCAQS